MSSLENFLDLETVSLKICGVTTLDDAQLLAKMGVDALGVNFWPNSNILIISVSGNFIRPQKPRASAAAHENLRHATPFSQGCTHQRLQP